MIEIFDCFFSACVPIYLGADNVTEYIPSECFIDKRKFNSYDSLYAFISNIRDDKYVNYLNSIEKFLNSNAAYQFSNEYFVKTLIKEIANR